MSALGMRSSRVVFVRHPLPAGPVELPSTRRLTFLQAMLLVSLLMHSVGLFGWSLTSAREEADTPLVRLIPVEMIRYHEHAPVVAVPTARKVSRAASPPPPAGPRVAYASGYVWERRAEPDPRARTRKRHNEPLLQETAITPPATTREVSAPRETPSPAASADPPDSASDATVSPSPTPSPVVAAAPIQIPSPSPVVTPPPASHRSRLIQNPSADFTLLLDYHNDDRIKRDARGSLQIDGNYLSTLSNVKPVLAQVPKQVLPLREAGRYGLHVMAQVKAIVKVSIDVQNGALSPLVAPTHVEVDDITIDGAAVSGSVRDQMLLFIQDGIAATMWLPASNKGLMIDRSEQTFGVEVVQVSEETAMSPPSSRAP